MISALEECSGFRVKKKKKAPSTAFQTFQSISTENIYVFFLWQIILGTSMEENSARRPKCESHTFVKALKRILPVQIK